MAHRAVLMNYSSIQASGTPGIFQVVGTAFFFDDNNTHPQQAGITVNVNFTQTGAQIQTAIVNEIINVATQMGFVLVAGASQMIIPTMAKV